MIGMKKTIDNVLSTFNTMIEDLKKIEQSEFNNQLKFEREASEAAANAVDSELKAKKAYDVRQRIEQIVGE